METLTTLTSSSPFLHQRPLSSCSKGTPPVFLRSSGKRSPLMVKAAKLPAGVEMPKVVPKISKPSLGFTSTAEVWNSRACMIGIIGTFIVELVFHKGILQMIGVEVGKGLDLPL